MATYTLLLGLQSDLEYPHLQTFLQLTCQEVVIPCFRVTPALQHHPALQSLSPLFPQMKIDESLASLEHLRDWDSFQAILHELHREKGLCVVSAAWLANLTSMYGYEKSLILWYTDEGAGPTMFSEYQQFVVSREEVPSTVPETQWPFGLGSTHVSVSLPVQRIVELTQNHAQFREFVDKFSEEVKRREIGICEETDRKITGRINELRDQTELRNTQKHLKIREKTAIYEAVNGLIPSLDLSIPPTTSDRLQARISSVHSRISALQDLVTSTTLTMTQKLQAAVLPKPNFPVYICQATAQNFNLCLILVNFKPRIDSIMYRIEGDSPAEKGVSDSIGPGPQYLILENVLIGRESLSISLWKKTEEDDIQLCERVSVTVIHTEMTPSLLTLPADAEFAALSTNSSGSAVPGSNEMYRAEEENRRNWMGSNHWGMTTLAYGPNFMGEQGLMSTVQDAYSVSPHLFHPSASSLPYFNMTTVQPQIFPPYYPS